MGANIGKFQTAKADALRQWRRAATLSAGEMMEGGGDAVVDETPEVYKKRKSKGPKPSNATQAIRL